MLGYINPIPYLYYITKRYNMNHLILNNFKEVSDDLIIDVFSYASIAEGVFNEGLFYGDRRLREDEKIDGYIYSILGKISKK
jgi:hypothetical protein